ncbi:hypothetical protein [Ascidiaceihabitans sp.]|uniref:hypothetical protein n=2 Tax=Ascidiaceihabitans sp. TaxID=1872644 RepID=UPI0032969816
MRTPFRPQLHKEYGCGDSIMRLIAAIMTLVALAAAAVAGQKLHLALTTSPAQSKGVTAANAALAEPTTATRQDLSFRWAAVFGELQAPTLYQEPQPTEIIDEQAAPAPTGPPIEALGYALKGVVRAGRSVWGMVSHPTGDQVVRVGDDLAQGVTVRKIDEAGLWIDNGGEELILLGFATEG